MQDTADPSKPDTDLEQRFAEPAAHLRPRSPRPNVGKHPGSRRDMLTPSERSLRARMASHTSWARTPDRSTRRAGPSSCPGSNARSIPKAFSTLGSAPSGPTTPSAPTSPASPTGRPSPAATERAEREC